MNALDVLGFGFSYQAREVLRDITFSVKPGEVVGLAGANGSGKSTLLWAIAGLLKGRGSIRIFGQNPRQGLSRTGVVFQNPEDQLFMPFLAQDLAMRLVNAGEGRLRAEEMAMAQLRRFGLHDAAHRPAAELSLGQRKRAAIAAAMVTSPGLLLVDEPTAELDGRSVRQLVDTLRNDVSAKLIASHHLEFEKVATRIVLLHDGRVEADGHVQAVLGNLRLLEATGLI